MPCQVYTSCAICVIGKTLDPTNETDPHSVPGTLQTFKKRHLIFQTGAQPYGLFVVCQGRVKIYKLTASGRLLTTRVASSGQLLGYRAFFANERYSCNAEALEPTTVRFFDRDIVRKTILSQPLILEELLRKLSIELRYSENREADIIYKPVRERLAQLLMRLGKLYSNSVDPSSLIPLTREEMAEMLGVSPETVIRLLKELQDVGAVSSEGYGKVRVHFKKLGEAPDFMTGITDFDNE